VYRRIRDSKESWHRILRLVGKRKPPKDGGVEPSEPVQPNRPKPLSGGAAAALEFDD